MPYCTLRYHWVGVTDRCAPSCFMCTRLRGATMVKDYNDCSHFYWMIFFWPQSLDDYWSQLSVNELLEGPPGFTVSAVYSFICIDIYIYTYYIYDYVYIYIYKYIWLYICIYTYICSQKKYKPLAGDQHTFKFSSSFSRRFIWLTRYSRLQWGLQMSR